MGRETGSVPHQNWHSAPQMPVCNIAPHSFGPRAPARAMEEKSGGERP